MALNFKFLGNVHSGSTITLSITTDPGFNLLIVPIAVHDSNETNHQTQSVTYNGINLTQIVEYDQISQTRTEIWGLLNPPAGTFNLVVTFSFLGFVDVGAYEFSGAENKLPTNFGGYTNGNGVTFIRSNVSSTVNGAIYVDVISSESAIGVDGSQTQWWQDQGQSFENGASSTYQQYNAGLKTMSWPSVGGNTSHAVVVVQPATAYASDLIVSSFADSSYLNEFLQTVGRISGTTIAYNILSSANVQSGIIIENVSINTTSTDGSLLVSSSDAVVVILNIATNVGGNIQFNGVTLTDLTNFTITNGGSTRRFHIYYIKNPPVGVSTITHIGGTSGTIFAFSILGTLKEDNPQVFTNTGTSSIANISVYPSVNNSLVLDNYLAIKSGGSTESIFAPNSNQNLVYASSIGSSSSAIVNANEQTFSWNNNNTPTDAWGIQAIILKPLRANSMSFPVWREKKTLDILNINEKLTIDTGNTTLNYKPYIATFYQNSFLHTIGRIGQANNPVATLVSETEQETSQIIIDKVFQGQKASQAASTVTLTMDVDIPSPDAVLVVTGGSVIATGAGFADVNFNGTKLTQLVQTGVAGQSAEIWYLPYPSVGIGQLTITSGVGGEINVNAMVILGVDKRSTNIQVASATDSASTSTIGALITPDSPNSLVIDTIAALDATAPPVPDSSQTQVFNATQLASSEYVLSTYKIASTAQNMNYNLSVAVNASLVAVAFRPAQAASLWFPNIDTRQLDDTVTTNSLDAETNPAFGQYGYKPSIFYQNSFLHTVGRLFGANSGGPYGILSSANVQSSIIIDQITITNGLSGATFDHSVSSPDAVLVVFTSTSAASDTTKVAFNGTNLTLLKQVSFSLDSGTNRFLDIWYLPTPSVGTYPITLTGTNSSITVMTLLGVNKKKLTPDVYNTIGRNGAPTLSIYPTSANTFVLDLLHQETPDGNTLSAAIPNANQTQINNDQGGGFQHLSYAIVNPGEQTLSWSLTSRPILNWGYIAVLFEPANPYSISYPSIRERISNDLIGSNALNTFRNGAFGFNKAFGYNPSQFWHNSFLHTTGRMFNIANPSTFTWQQLNNPSEMPVEHLYRTEVIDY